MKISVIIPVYNGEKFIDEFMECLSQQTIEEYEAIFIDDNSSDQTGILLREAVAKDKRFSYYCNETRQGAAYSRNRGIELSHAPYVLCLDADDRFEPDLLEQVTDAAYIYDADMVMLERGDFKGFDLHTIRRTQKMFEDEKSLLSKQVFSVIDQPIDFLLRCENGTCDRVVRRDLLDRYQIRFQNLKNSNDVFYTVFSTLAAERIVHTDTFDYLYHRRVHSESDRISNQRDPMCAFQALLAIHDNLIKFDLWETYCVYFWIFALDSLEKQLFVCKNFEWQKQVYKFVQEEGLYQLGIKNDTNYVRLPREVQEQYSKFLVMPYEKKCFNKSMIMEALSNLYSFKLLALAESMKDKQLGFWGAGRITPIFIESYKQQGGIINFVIDNDGRKQGDAVEEVEIVAFEDVYDKLDAIIISNRHFYNPISEQILGKSQEIEILSLEEIIYK